MTTSPTPTGGEAGSPALDSLNGLSVGDALGAQFFVPGRAAALAARTAPPGPWPWTDDTEMACSVHAALEERGDLDQFDLAHAFAHRHDFDRGYGPAANRLLRLVREGGDWQALAAAQFDGQGSYGNGAAMRIAPLGARHAADPAAAVGPAARAAAVTHTHPQAVDGAIAVAVAAAHAARSREDPAPTPAEFLHAVLDLTPHGAVRDGVAEAAALLDEDSPHTAALILGNGSRVSAADTVPLTLWCAARHLDDYPAAVWDAVSAGGDVDTTAAIVGGIVAARTGTSGIPPRWLAAREALPHWTTPEPGSVARPDTFSRGDGQGLELPRPIPAPRLTWTAAEWQLLRRGLRPQHMDDRWFSYTSEGILHLHRSWTGLPVYQVRVAALRDGGRRPVEALVESHPGRYRRGSDPVETDRLAQLLEMAARPD
jgi:ADP-ribosylglycohydrolase